MQGETALILLNGRRLANFATPGDKAGVDLNNIPAGAIQRVEILKDGASAIYGTDAIGGVINFITRKDYRGVDLAPGCNPPASVYAPASYGGAFGCSYDYMQDTEIQPASDKNSSLGRGTFQLAPEHQLYAELMQSQAKTTYLMSPNPQNFSNFPVADLPAAYRGALSGPGMPSTVNRIQLRMTEAGKRTDLLTSKGQRLLLGANGTVGNWDYDFGLARAENTVVDRYVNGYVLDDPYEAGLYSGGIGGTFNPKLGLRWQPGKQWLVRGSAGTGFRAPSLADM